MKTRLLFIAVIILAITSCHQTQNVKQGTIKISILYPYEEGKSFDMTYYSDNHMPMVAKLFGEPLIRYDIEQGMAGRTPEDPLPYVAIGTFYFDSLEAYQSAFEANAERILGDIPNYTDIKPIVQISEVLY